MKPEANAAKVSHKFSTTILFCAMLAVLTGVACSSKPKSSAKKQEPFGSKVQPVALRTTEPVSVVAEQPKMDVAPKPAPNKLLTFKSRDYGVSFLYPYQYAFLNAKTIANADASLQPKADGHDGQFTLASVEIPKGFYPDTNFDRGYFTLSLNQDMNEEECIAILGKDANKLPSEKINGVDFRWMQSEDGGRGASSLVRNYVSYTNGTCYELEMGVKTRNEQGQAREVNPDQVLRRLQGIANSVKLSQNTKVTVIESADEATPTPQEAKN